METIISFTITNFLIVASGIFLAGMKIGKEIQKAKK